MEPIKGVLKTSGFKDDFTLPNGAVAGKFFHPGPTGFDHMQALLKTGAKDALPTIERYAATTLRRTALKPDGTLDPSKLAAWQKGYAEALRALPADLRAKFADAARATETLAEAQAARTRTLKEAQQGALGKIMGLTEPEDITRKVGQALNSVADTKALARATASDPLARQGLRRAAVDHIVGKFVSNTGALKSDGFQTFIREKRAALHLIFSPEEVRSMEAVAEDLNRSARSQQTKLPGRSNSPQDLAKPLKALAQGAQRTWLEVVGGVLGSSAGPWGTAAGIGVAHLVRSLRAAGVARIDQLVSKAMLEPKLAHELLKKAPRKAANWNAGAAPLTAALWGAAQPRKDDR